MQENGFSGNLPWLGEQRKGFRSSLQRPGFGPAGAQPHPGFSYQDEQGMDGDCVVGGAAVLLPGHPDLHCVLETELARDLIGEQGGLCHLMGGSKLMARSGSV